MYISMTRFTGVCTLFILVCNSIYAASDLPTEAQYITLDEAIANSLENNPHLLAFGYQLDIKRSRVQQASLAPNPDLLITVEDAFGTDDYQGFKSAETTVSLGWVFERAVRESRVSAAQTSESLSAADIEVLRVDIAAETADRFLTLVANQARAETAAEAVGLAERTVQAVQRRVEAGRSPEAELTRAQVELAYAMLAQDDIKHELRVSRHRLAAQWGSTQPDFTRAQGNPLKLPTVSPLQDLKQQAEQNPQMKRYMTKQRLDEAQLRLAQAQRKPGWKGLIGVRRYESIDDFALVAGFAIPLAIRNQNQGNIAEARAAADQTFAEAAATRQNIETTLFVFYEALQHNLHVATALRDEVLPRIESALAETQSAYESGRYSYFDWRSVQADLIGARNALIEASIGAHKNVIEIERLTGTRMANGGTAP